MNFIISKTVEKINKSLHTLPKFLITRQKRECSNIGSIKKFFLRIRLRQSLGHRSGGVGLRHLLVGIVLAAFGVFCIVSPEHTRMPSLLVLRKPFTGKYFQQKTIPPQKGKSNPAKAFHQLNHLRGNNALPPLHGHASSEAWVRVSSFSWSSGL